MHNQEIAGPMHETPRTGRHVDQLAARSASLRWQRALSDQTGWRALQHTTSPNTRSTSALPMSRWHLKNLSIGEYSRRLELQQHHIL